MIIRNYPQEFASAFEPVVFKMDAVWLDASLGATIGIMQSGKTEPVGTKRFYNSSKLSVDVAPYALACLNIKPLSSGYELRQMTERTASIYITTEGEVSEARHIAAGREVLPTEVLLSEHRVRRIAAGQVDEFSFIPPAGDVWVEMKVSDVTAKTHSWRLPPFISDGGMVACVVDMRVIAGKVAEEAGLQADSLDKIKVVVYYGASTAFEVNYVVEKATVGGARLAWVNRYGTVDCYNFPVCCERRVVVQRTSEIEVGDTVKYPMEKVQEELTISSGLQSESVVGWLSDIVSAPKVWIWKDGLWSECCVMDNSQTIFKAGEPSAVRLTLRNSENIKTQTL